MKRAAYSGGILFLFFFVNVYAQAWSLVWSDEFDYNGLPDGTRWGYEVGGHGWGNGESQFYTDGREENASVDQETGLLTITARMENWEGNQYTSAKLNSNRGTTNRGSWIGARIEIRSILPAGRGTWPAFWMMPNNCAEGWPRCGEIDIMEHVGKDEGRVHGTIHTGSFNHIQGTQKGGNTMISDATSAFHIYGLEWSEDRIEWFVDDEVYFTLDREPNWGFNEWPFNDKPFHIKINIAIGGSWGGEIDNSIFPVSMLIDYVRVYEWDPLAASVWERKNAGEQSDLAITEFKAQQSSVSISYSLKRSSDISMGLYTINGRIVKELARGYTPAGNHTISTDWGTGDLTNGIYVARLCSGDGTVEKRVHVVR